MRKYACVQGYWCATLTRVCDTAISGLLKGQLRLSLGGDDVVACSEHVRVVW